MAIVYRHRRLDTFKIFYIGIGKTEKRAYNKNNNRNNYWKNIISKTDYSVEIIAKGISWEEACELEVLLIKEYGRKDLNEGCLVNMTDGGDGSKGYVRLNKSIVSNETRKKMSDAQKRNGISKDHRDKINLGFKNMSKDSRYNMSKTQFKPKKVINTLTNEIYNSVKELSISCNLNYSTLKKRLSGTTKNYTNFKYL